MAFRGWFSLNGVEIVNTSRVVSHMGGEVPTDDASVFGGGSGSYGLVPVSGHPGLYEVPATSASISGHTGIYSPPNGAYRYDRGLYLVDSDGWGPNTPCSGCRSHVVYDDSWPGLKDFLSDTVYRLELAPWYSSRIPESAEFAGAWVLDVKGLGPTPMARTINEMVGDGAAAGPMRNTSRTVQFDALLLACTNAGLEFGLQWLACQLRDTKATTDSVLRYLTAHPGHSAADPATLVREVHNVVMTKNVTVNEAHNMGGSMNQQATAYRVSWELAVLSPFAYLPQTPVTVNWDSVVTQPISWVHAADCTAPFDCDTMPVLFSDTCAPEQIEIVSAPPPVCGGCLPVCEIDTYTFTVPTMDTPLLCRDTAASLTITNVGENTLTLSAHWEKTNVSEGCANEYWPVQVSGLPPSASIVLDAINGRFYALLDNTRHVARGIVGTPNGSPWLPPILDRHEGWQLVIDAPGDVEFDVAMSLADREA